ncbi:MAG: hypothetical protein DME69_09180 [Verrucomicrobia bacterium]|nr:MAG: hypothetical protein DME69_09180 [Verrucomicrobiota bacterium]
MRHVNIAAALVASMLLCSCLYNDDIPPTAKIDGAVGSVSQADLHAVMLRFNEWISEVGHPQPVYRIHVVSPDKIDIHYQIAPGPHYPPECRPFESC